MLVFADGCLYKISKTMKKLYDCDVIFCQTKMKCNIKIILCL